MTSPRPSASRRPDPLPDVAAQADLITDVLPGGWHQIFVPGVERPVVLGPGGVFVLDVRQPGALPLGLDRDRPWGHDHRNQLSTPQIAAELCSQLLTWACGTDVVAHPVIVITADDVPGAPATAGTSPTDDAVIVPRPDGVEVIHQHLLMRWLSNLPAELDAADIALIVEHVSPAPGEPAAGSTAATSTASPAPSTPAYVRS